MLPADESFLAIVRDTLARDVAPQTSGETRTLLDAGIRLALDELVYRGTAGPDRQRTILEDLRTLARRHNDLIAACPRAGAKPVEVPPAGEDSPSTFADWTLRIDQLRGLIVKQAPRIAAALADAAIDSKWRDKAREFLLALTRNELDEMLRDQGKAGVTAGRGDRIEANKARLQDVIRARLGMADLRITDHRRLSGGFSRDTLMVSTLARGETRHYVIRAATVGYSHMDTGIYRSIEEEFPILQLAWQQGIPVARPHFLETDPGVIGSSFIFMDHCAGAAIGSITHASDPVDLGLFRKLAKTLAQIHQLPWAENIAMFPSLGGRTRMTLAEGTQLFLDTNQRWRNTATLRPSPAITLAFDWLARNIPPNDGPAQFILGDIGFHNMLVDGKEIHAVVDWESASVGHPAWDLVAAALMLDERVTWKEFADWYVKAGGTLPTDEELAYYRMMRALSGNLTCSLVYENAFEKSGYANYLALGMAMRPYFQAQFLDNAAQLWKTNH